MLIFRMILLVQVASTYTIRLLKQVLNYYEWSSTRTCKVLNAVFLSGKIKQTIFVWITHTHSTETETETKNSLFLRTRTLDINLILFLQFQIRLHKFHNKNLPSFNPPKQLTK